MRNSVSLTHEFVDTIPPNLDDEKLYISIEYATVVHKCACGCGNEVVTPLSPTDWKLIFDGVSVSLTPSIGNWSFECKSHYWINLDEVRFAGEWCEEQIDAGRKQDHLRKTRYFSTDRGGSVSERVDIELPSSLQRSRNNIWSWFFGWWQHK